MSRHKVSQHTADCDVIYKRVMQTRGKWDCPDSPECSLSYTKVRQNDGIMK